VKNVLGSVYFMRKDANMHEQFCPVDLLADFLKASEALLGLLCPSSMKDRRHTTQADSVYRITQQLLSPVFSRFL
jgi:hypothetical protein